MVNEKSRYVTVAWALSRKTSKYQQIKFEPILKAMRKILNILQCLSRMLWHFFKTGNHKFDERKICLSTFYANKLCKIS